MQAHEELSIPPELIGRVQHDPRDPALCAKLTRREILRLLPADWSWTGKRVLDFGCGPGRVLREFSNEAKQAAFYGCDIHAPSIEWLRSHPPFDIELALTKEMPPLPWADNTFDLCWVVSVFTHLTDSWAAWLLELRRILVPNGLLIATFHGDAMGAGLRLPPYNEEWSEERFGMNVLMPTEDWDAGGPGVFHSPWWIQAHWGRAFEIVTLRPSGFTTDDASGHGVVLMRANGDSLRPEDLSTPEPGEPREFSYLKANRDQLIREILSLRERCDRAEQKLNIVRKWAGPAIRFRRLLNELSGQSRLPRG
jgi:SAM-dependent methyltransferase